MVVIYYMIFHVHKILIWSRRKCAIIKDVFSTQLELTKCLHHTFIILFYLFLEATYLSLKTVENLNIQRVHNLN